MRLELQTAADEVLSLRGELPAELDVSRADLVVAVIGDVAAEHVIEQHPQRPHLGEAPEVSPVHNPLRRAVDTSSCKTRVVCTLEQKIGCANA